MHRIFIDIDQLSHVMSMLIEGQKKGEKVLQKPKNQMLTMTEKIKQPLFGLWSGRERHLTHLTLAWVKVSTHTYI